MDIVATGMVCPVGLTALASCAAMRARIARFNDLPYCGARGEPIIGATVPLLSPALTFPEKLVETLALAIDDCLSSAQVRRTDPLPLLVAWAEPGRPGRVDLEDGAFAAVEARLGLRLDRKRSRVIAKGHTAGFEALRIARQLLQDSSVSACLVCGVDSYIRAQTLWWLDQNTRLKTTENSDGVIPGEAAACVLVRRPEAKGAMACSARVLGLGFGFETATVSNEEPLLGLGLTAATRAALSEANLQMHEIDLRISDATGESYGFKEACLVVGRLMRSRRESIPIWHCADSIGDTGAAAGVCQLVIALAAFRKGYAPGTRILCQTSAVPGERAAAALERHATDEMNR